MKAMKVMEATKFKTTAPVIALWFGFCWSWIFFTDLIDLAGSKPLGYLLASVVLIINVSVSTLVVCLTFGMLDRYRRRLYRSNNHLLSAFPRIKRHSSWVFLLGSLPVLAVADFLVAWLVAVLWLGPQGQIDTMLPMGSPTLVLMGTPLRFAVRLLGMHGLAACVWLVVYVLLCVRRPKILIVPITLSATLAVIGWLVWRVPSGTNVHTVVISERLTQRVAPIDAHNLDLVVFPEYGLDEINSANLGDRITSKSSSPTAFVGSRRTYQPGTPGHYNSQIFGTTARGIISQQHKSRLIPGGEDLPYLTRAFLRSTGQGDALTYFTYTKSVIRGSDPISVFRLNDRLSVASAVCSSIITPQDYRRLTGDGANILTNSASLSVFANARLFLWQQQRLAQFMATANARPFLQSSNATSAYVLDWQGTIIASVNARETLRTTVTTNHRKTLYTQIGEWLVWLGFGLLLLLLALPVGGRLRTYFRARLYAKIKS